MGAERSGMEELSQDLRRICGDVMRTAPISARFADPTVHWLWEMTTPSSCHPATTSFPDGKSWSSKEVLASSSSSSTRLHFIQTSLKGCPALMFDDFMVSQLGNYCGSNSSTFIIFVICPSLLEGILTLSLILLNVLGVLLLSIIYGEL
ncbi:hypothetical protein KFK09_022661 [Dendrobium nobile]|uniref:Uncharacterized protein n=1 Tax=Dendrobium nobile TaxID=94219 RepID=A0A8T3AQI3_DENNO|nr:hypothetical protein KFK09_022661 [Dendrobium nobile]